MRTWRRPSCCLLWRLLGSNLRFECVAGKVCVYVGGVSFKASLCLCLSLLPPVCVSFCMCESRLITHARDQVRLWGLDQASTKVRLKRGLDVLRERKQILQAKMALCSLNFD